MGEDELIQTIFAPLSVGFPGALGLKDDCALLTPEPGFDLVLTTDAVAEGVHFLPDDAPADIAWKALAVNVSDLVAKGARPVAYLLSLSFPERPARIWLDAFAAGLGEAQRAYSIALAGGDTDRRPGPLTVTISAVGAVPAGRFVRRGSGRAGDDLLLSGTIGDGALGLLMRQDPERGAALGLGADDIGHLVARYLRPQPRLGLAAHVLSFASAAMDVSDGLVKDCARLALASGVGAEIDAVRLPLSPAARAAIARDPSLMASVLGGGDDYEVLAAASPERRAAFRESALASGVKLTCIGRLVAGTGVAVFDGDGREIEISRAGWDHFPESGR